MPTIELVKNNLGAIALGILCSAYFIAQPHDRFIADGFWLALSLLSIIQIIYLKLKGTEFILPKELKTLLWITASLPIVSIISYVASPLDNLTPTLLEPDSRWWLVIPIVIAMRHYQIGPKWIAFFLACYTVSTFISAGLETQWFQNMNRRATGGENAVPYGMFNATIAALWLVFFVSGYIKNLNTSKQNILIIRGFILIMATLSAIAAVASGTRAALLLIPIAIVFIFIRHYPLKRSIPLSIGLITVLGIAFYVSPPSAVKNKLNHAYQNVENFFVIGDKRSKLTSAGQRLEQWRESWCIFTKHPITGTGPRSFGEAHQAYGGPDHCDAVQALAHGTYQAHSFYFNHLGTLGLIGILSIFAWFYYSARPALQQLQSTNLVTNLGASAMLFLLMTFLVNGITLDLWFRNHVMNKHLLIWGLPLLLLFSANCNKAKAS